VDVIPDATEAGWDRVEVTRSGDNADTIVRKLLRVAVDRRVSDIHLETAERRLNVRFRIDGVLQHFNLAALAEDLDLQRAEVFSRLKIMSGLDISERRRPQGGSFRARIKSEGRVVSMDFRVSIIPGYYGESAVIRVLDPRRAPESIEVLGLAKPVVTALQTILRASTGMLLVTGPTGSGKSTTLFGLLNSVYRPEIKILTAEDPIEYVCERFSQHEVNERVGNTFASYVRAFLRHDPEVIMIGEIRDALTAELALRAAQTGHLVLSTCTPTTPSAPSRDYKIWAWTPTSARRPSSACSPSVSCARCAGTARRSTRRPTRCCTTCSRCPRGACAGTAASAAPSATTRGTAAAWPWSNSGAPATTTSASSTAAPRSTRSAAAPRRARSTWPTTPSPASAPAARPSRSSSAPSHTPRSATSAPPRSQPALPALDNRPISR
jgi:Tfp pilus assembly pilus retraction ATPase PilT